MGSLRATKFWLHYTQAARPQEGHTLGSLCVRQDGDGACPSSYYEAIFITSL